MRRTYKVNDLVALVHKQRRTYAVGTIRRVEDGMLHVSVGRRRLLFVDARRDCRFFVRVITPFFSDWI